MEYDGAEIIIELDMEVASVSEAYHKGLAKNILPDMVGLLNSCLWSLWSPNI